MRIAYLCLDPGIPLRGSKGASNHVREVCAAFEAQGHEVELFGARMGKGEERLPRVVHQVGTPTSPDMAPQQREEQELDRNNHLECALREAHRRRPFDMIYERYSLWSFAAAKMAAAWGVPYVAEVNSPLRREQAEHRRLILDSVAAQVEREVFGNADLVVCVSPAVSDYVATVRRGRDGVLTLPNGVDLGLFADPTPRRSTDGPFVIGFAGSLKPWHGVETLLDAFIELAEADDVYRLLIVGDGPKRVEMERRLEAGGLLDRAEFTGAVPKEQIPRYLRWMDVATAPYEQLEDFYFSPLKVFEYMAAGTPIVASCIGQIPEILDHGRTGLLSEPGRAADLAEQIRRLSLDRGLAALLGAEARREAFQQHGWERRVKTILDEVLGQSVAVGAY